MAAWSGSDRERNMSRKMGVEDETATASSVLHKAEGRRLSLSLPLSPFTWLIWEAGTQVCAVGVCWCAACRAVVCVCVWPLSACTLQLSDHQSAKSHSKKKKRKQQPEQTICARGSDRVRGVSEWRSGHRPCWDTASACCWLDSVVFTGTVIRGCDRGRRWRDTMRKVPKKRQRRSSLLGSSLCLSLPFVFIPVI